MYTALFQIPIEVVCIDSIPNEAVKYCLDRGALPLIVDNTYNVIGFTYLHNTHNFIVLLEEYHETQISWGLKWFRTKETNKPLYSLLENSGWDAISEYLRKNN